MKRAGKGHIVSKKKRLGRVEKPTPFERKRRALMEAASRTVAQLSLPPSPPMPEIAPAYARSLAQLVEAASAYGSAARGTAGRSERTVARGLREDRGIPQDGRRRIGENRARVAVAAFVMAAMGGVALVRACEPKAAPIEDDAAATDSCSDDASLCVARA